MIAILIIAGLTAVNQLLSLIDDWQKSKDSSNLQTFLGFLKGEKIKITSFFIALVLTAITGFLSYDSERSTNQIIREVDTTRMKVDTVKVLADSIGELQRDLVNAYREIADLQIERHNEIVGGNSPPTLKMVSRMYPLSYVKFVRGVRSDSTAFHVLFTFIFINESPYIIKSARVTIDHLDYLNQRRFLNSTYKKDPGQWGIMKFNNSHEVHEFNTMPPDSLGLRSKAFTIMVPLEGYAVYQFFLSVEWSNGYYTAEIEVKPGSNFNAIQYFKGAPEYAKIYKMRPTKAEFRPLPGRRNPRFIFIHEPQTFTPFGELRNE
jgi:hypothetical protein